VRRSRVSEYATVIAAIIDFVVSILLLREALQHRLTFLHNYILLDNLGAWVILCVSIVYALASIYAVGYMRLLDEDERLPLFYALFSGFAFTMLGACVMNNVGVYWIAIELTTLISTFLVGFEQEAESTRSRLEIHRRGFGGHQSRIIGYGTFLLGRVVCSRSELCDDLGCLAWIRCAGLSTVVNRFVPLGARWIRNQSRASADAHLAPGCS